MLVGAIGTISAPPWAFKIYAWFQDFGFHFSLFNVMYRFHILEVTMTDTYVRVLDVLLVCTMLPDEVFIVVGSLWPGCHSCLLLRLVI